MAGQVLAAAECVPQVVQVGDKPSLQEKFMDFCMSPLPPKVTAITKVDKYWHAISQIKDCLETEYRYSTLAKLAKVTLVIPHGNADTEGLFSHIGLNKMKHRNRLGISTLNSLLTQQFNVPKKCYEFKLNTELLKTCVNAMNTLYYVISHEIVVWIFCCQKVWITQASNLEITKKIMATLYLVKFWGYCIVLFQVMVVLVHAISLIRSQI